MKTITKRNGSRHTDTADLSLIHGYPRPQLMRSQWTCLNGEWDFAIDHDGAVASPKAVNWQKSKTIVVPYAPESPKSGIADTGFFKAVWYRRAIVAPKLVNGERLILHFGAVDWSCSVYIDGHLAGLHEGGYTPFSVDITEFMVNGNGGKNGRHVITVRAVDDPHDLNKPRGKQDWELNAHGIWYPRTTGIWQTVWMETVPAASVASIHWTPKMDEWSIALAARLEGNVRAGMKLRVKLSHRGRALCDDSYTLCEDEVRALSLKRTISLPDGGIDACRDKLLWSPDHPELIDAEVTLVQASGGAIDTVSSYTAMRSVATTGGRFLLNDRPLDLRLVLDQGYWADTGLTPPDDAACRKDVELAKELGFNGVRKHQKIESPRFLYWADKQGLMVWEEMPSAYAFSARTVETVTRQWMEAIERDKSHPCIIAWVPINESWGVPDLLKSEAQRDFVRGLYRLTRSLDGTRPVIGNDGWELVDSDIIAIHDYDSRNSAIADRYQDNEEAIEKLLHNPGPAGRWILPKSDSRRERPIMVTEFGGIKYSTDPGSWGYTSVKSPEELAQKVAEVLAVIRSSPLLSGFCYTQFTDTYQEANGLVFMDRKPKFSAEEIRRTICG